MGGTAYFFGGIPHELGEFPILIHLLLHFYTRAGTILQKRAGTRSPLSGGPSYSPRFFSMQSFLEPFLSIRGSASLWALCTGGTIAGYSLVDKIGVTIVYPPVYIYLMFVISLLLLSPYVLAKERLTLKKEWQINKVPILIVGFLVSLLT